MILWLMERNKAIDEMKERKRMNEEPVVCEWIQCTINSIQRMNWLSAIEWMTTMLLAASIEFIHSFHALKWNEVKFNEPQVK